MKPFGHAVNGKERPARRISRGGLGLNYGPDKGRQLIVSLEAGDLVCFRPKGTRQHYCASAFDLFAYIIRRRALAKAREQREWRKERAR